MARNVTCQSAIGNFPPTVFQQLWRTANHRYLPLVSISSISIHCMNYFAQIIDVWHSRFHSLPLSLWINKEGTFLFRRAKQVTTVTNISLLKKVAIRATMRCENQKQWCVKATEHNSSCECCQCKTEALQGWWAEDNYSGTSPLHPSFGLSQQTPQTWDNKTKKQINFTDV